MDNQFISCPLCNKKGKMLKQHMREVHNMTPEEFYNKYPDNLLVAPSTSKRRSSFTTKRNLSNWKDDTYRSHMTDILKTREVTWKSNSDDRKLHPDKYSKIASLGGKMTIKLYGQKFLTKGKLDSKKFHELKSKECSRLAYRLHHDPVYEDVRKIIEGPKDGNLIEYTSSNGKLVKLRSSFELKTYNFLERLGIDFEYEPSSLITSYELSDGTSHHYYPDFLIKNLNTVIECKPSCYTKNEVFSSKRKSIEELGYRFITFTEHEVNDPKLMESLLYET